VPKKGLHRHRVVGDLDDAGQELNAAQIDKLTEFLEQEGQVKVSKYFGSKWY
jgi:hypothetical protein